MNSCFISSKIFSNPVPPVGFLQKVFQFAISLGVNIFGKIAG